MSDNNDFTHEFQIFSSDQNAGTMGTGKFMLYDNDINALKIDNIENIKIGGGENGQLLMTDGDGNLTWITSTGGGGVQVNADWNSSSGASRILNKPDLNNYLLKSGGTLTGKLSAAQGAGTTGGYSFGGTEGGADTGMFSNADGVLDFYANNVKIVTVTTGGVTSTQAITLPGNPTSNLQAATKQYVDTSVGALNNFSGNYNDLTNKPTIASSVFLGTTSVAFNRSSGALTLSGVSIDGNAGTVSNGVYTTGTYSDPAWITGLAYSKLTGAPSLATVATSGAYADLSGKPSLATVATSGSYNDLTNKPTIPVVPTNVSSFTNDAGYLTSVTNISGNAATVSNGVYTTGSYADPAWITSLAYSKLTGAPTIPNLASVNEHILPTTDVTYDLGSPTKQWRSLYLSGSTIYLGGTALSVDSSGNFSIDGNTVINSSGAAVDIDWNDITNKPAIPVDIGDLTDTGNLLGSGGGGGATTLSALTDVALEGPVEGSVLTWNSSQNKWENRSLPSSNEITNTDGMNTYAVSVSTTGIVTMTTARGSLEFGAQPEEGAPQHLHIMRPVGQSGATDLYFGDDYNYFKLPGNYGVGTLGVDIGANDLNGGNQYVWRFGTDGNLTVPGNIYGPNNGSTLVLGQAVDSNNAFVSIPSFADGGELLTIQNNFNADTGGIQVNTNGYLDLNGKTVNLNGSTSITAIAGSYQWRFNNDGRFQLPTNGIIQQNGSYTRTTTPGINGATTSGVVWTSLYNDISSAKLTIQSETNEVDDTTGWHTQICEAIIASRGSVIGGDPIMTVYGVTYTSTVPLVTFTVQRNPTTQLIEVVATRTAATVEGISFRIHSVEMKTRD